MANTSLVLPSSLKLIPHCSRLLFFWIILIISVITLLGNALAIKSVLIRKQKCLQKVCIISLALADIFSVAVFATNNLDTLSRELKIWKLGEFLCHFIPMGQILGTTTSSVVLLLIALDRYQNVTVAIVSQRWNPSVWKCVAVAFIFLLVCTVASYPMYILFTLNSIQIVYPDGPELVFEDAFLCVAVEKDKLKVYYMVLAVMVFLPIIVTFIWFYYQIAAMVWRHRKPPLSKYHHSKPSCNKIPSVFVKRTRTVQVQRKIRTFKVIIVLMVAFVACRLPYWLFFVIKLLETMKGSTTWYLHFSFTSLNMLNCALNPFMYAFLNQTTTRKCHDVAHKILLRCCGFNGKDFEEIHKNSPFVVNCNARKDGVEKGERVGNSKIKFADVATPVYTRTIPLKEQFI